MESYTTILFMVDEKERNLLKIKDFYSLSKNIKEDCRLRSGEGIIGWVLREQKSVLATYFDKRDATTLNFYNKDENIKSVLAIPLAEKSGVLCVDSKKSYFFTEEREKILRQMGNILVSIIKNDIEIKEKRKTDTLLDLSLNFNKIIVNSNKKQEFVEKILFLLSDVFNLKIIVFLIEDENIFLIHEENKKYIFKKVNYHFYDKYGLSGWIIKNKKELLLENISKNEKSYIVNKEEKFDYFTNFFGLPLCCDEKKGVISFVKKNNEKWLSKEIKILAFICDLFFKEYFQKNETVEFFS
ncbi:MAG: GAF domain-containing protein [Pseudomonadota bacterium]